MPKLPRQGALSAPGVEAVGSSPVGGRALPMVSIAVVARDAGESIGAPVASIWEQSLREIEVVIVDAGSRDGTAAASVLPALERRVARAVERRPLIGYGALSGRVSAALQAVCFGGLPL